MWTNAQLIAHLQTLPPDAQAFVAGAIEGDGGSDMYVGGFGEVTYEFKKNVTALGIVGEKLDGLNGIMSFPIWINECDAESLVPIVASQGAKFTPEVEEKYGEIIAEARRRKAISDEIAAGFKSC